jgi:hypothetical protein
VGRIQLAAVLLYGIRHKLIKLKKTFMYIDQYDAHRYAVAGTGLAGLEIVRIPHPQHFYMM